MEIEHDGEVRRYDCAEGKTLVLGRSQRADYPLKELGASNVHAEVRAGASGLRIKDCSQNGTGYATAEGEMVRMAKGVDTPMSSGVRLIIPYSRPGGGGNDSYDERVHCVRCFGNEQEHQRKERPLPVQDTQAGEGRSDFPATWPRSWSSLPGALKEAWAAEGIEDAQDLAGFYSNQDEIIRVARELGLSQAEALRVVDRWKDSKRGAGSACSHRQAPVVADVEPMRAPGAKRPLAKPKRAGPVQLNAPGLWHKQWQEKEAKKAERARTAQGTVQPRPEQLDPVWELYRRAGRSSTLYKEVDEDKVADLKSLVVKPFARFADSLTSRLAAWRRWEAWMEVNEPKLSPFRPGDVAMGRFLLQVDKGGPTAANQAWAALRWWEQKLGLELSLNTPLVADFRLKKQGHTTKQAEVIPLTMIPQLRVDAECRDVRGVLASLMLVVAGGCIRFKHVQRSELVEVTEDLLIFRCFMGKRRQQGTREAFRWASPRSWAPGHDTTRGAVELFQEIRKKAPRYAEVPFLVPDIVTTAGTAMAPGDKWMPRPMGYGKFVSLMRECLKSYSATQEVKNYTFNTLRRLMPTGADVLQFNDTIAAAIGNWQEIPGGRNDKKGRVKNQMAKRYAGEKIYTAGRYKLMVVVAINRSENAVGGASWGNVRAQDPGKRQLGLELRAYRSEIRAEEGTGDMCTSTLTQGPLKRRKPEPDRYVPPLNELRWLMQSRPQAGQRPWVHFSADQGNTPYCRSTPFKRDPVKQGTGVTEAAATGERPCPRCMSLMGDAGQKIVNEFFDVES